ncbi:uncharacterized protein VTP21DRAFT_10004 [Calcarisporiella thermophila]|uniref:uncharacterized protein n=1 Tax=Calcarisporiella thermophila TaxID=911321 RepID=UPI0037449E88
MILILFLVHLAFVTFALAGPAKVITECIVPGSIAITFDDGPFQYTSDLVKWLNENNLKATFFVCGQNWDSIEKYADVLREAHRTGHLIGSHTWSHADLTKLNETQIRSEMSQLEVTLKEIIGVRPRYMRPPYGEVDDRALRVLSMMDYKVINWDIDSMDWTSTNIEQQKDIYEKALQNSSTSHHISLQHDPYDSTAHDLGPWAFKLAVSKGLKPMTVAECLGEKDREKWYRP